MAISLSSTDTFQDRHTGSSPDQVSEMLETLGLQSLDQLIEQTIPASIRMERDLNLPDSLSESELLARLATLASKNKCYRSYIGMGYHGSVTPPAIQRGILENPSWYTQYTPYQAEISQGRLEALLNFQTVVLDLTGMDIANASLLDEGTAAAEAMMMLRRMDRKGGRTRFLVSDACHPQTIAVVASRARPIGIEVEVGPVDGFSFDASVIGTLVQYPDTNGEIVDYEPLCASAHEHGSFVVVAADLLSLTLLSEPATFGADVVVGSTQRFGVPMGFGGPHAAFFAVRERFKRQTPGRIIGVSMDADGKPALRMALQTREQHIRRDRATSNICTSQVLLAVMASMYAVYHGPEGLRAIARRIHDATRVLATGLTGFGYRIRTRHFFDTLVVDVSSDAQAIVQERALAHEINLRYFENGNIGITLDETISEDDLLDLLIIFNLDSTDSDLSDLSDLIDRTGSETSSALRRTSAFMEHEVFSLYHSETELTRYMYRLSSRDLSLTGSMIPLGSCTMKLNAVAELVPISWAGFNSIHPFVPESQVKGYRELTNQLESWLAEITGFARTSLQPNSGASGEYTGLLTIRAYQEGNGQGNRDICLIPSSAHGTNPASAIMAGLKVIVVACDEAGNIDTEDLLRRAEEHADNLAAFMVTYPSTHGVFEESIKEVCSIVHERGGQVYMDGANMNAQVGFCRPGDIGADVCHLNLHKTFAIPHGGGGPGVGPICVASHLAPYLPSHPVIPANTEATAIGPVAAAPFGSASILPISWAYIAMLGADGLKKSTQMSILNANYMARRLSAYFDILYTGSNGRVAHEFILDLRHIRHETILTEVDVAKRLMDYGIHAPTMSWPVVGTMMVEPTESESRPELDRFCDAMVSIHAELQRVLDGQVTAEDSILANAPHTAEMTTANEWNQVYSREEAAFPSNASRRFKFWPSVRRINDAAGDRNLICSCQSVESYAEESQRNTGVRNS